MSVRNGQPDRVRVLGFVNKNGREIVRVALVRFGTLDVLDLRICERGTDNRFTYTSRGVSIPANRLDELSILIWQAKEILKK